jgi:hypothetical protein
MCHDRPVDLLVVDNEVKVVPSVQGFELVRGSCLLSFSS